MKITKREETKVFFKNLDIGEVFMYNEDLYIKTEKVVFAAEVNYVTPDNVSEFILTAINLKSGLFVGFFKEDTVITPVDCELLYKK